MTDTKGCAADAAASPACRICGSDEDLRFGVCFECVSNKERELCLGERGCEYDDRPGTAFCNRCVWCDLPRGLAKHFTESHGDRSSLSADTPAERTESSPTTSEDK